jgi:hypothetical protein
MRILQEYNLGLENDVLMNLYQYCCRSNEDFLMIDLSAPAESKFRRNYLEVLDINNFL